MLSNSKMSERHFRKNKGWSETEPFVLIKVKSRAVSPAGHSQVSPISSIFAALP